MKWNDVSGLCGDFMRSGGITCIYSCENSVNLSRQINFLTITQSFKERNLKTTGLLIEKALQGPIDRALLTSFRIIMTDKRPAARILMKYFQRFERNRLAESISVFSTYNYIKRFIEDYSAKINYQTKRMKYTLPTKSRKLATRQISKLLLIAYMRMNLMKFKKNATKLSKKFSYSVTKSPKSNQFPIKNTGLSKSFVMAPHEFSPKIKTKFDDMKFSVKKIKYHHGFEKLWVAYRKITSKTVKKSIYKFFQKWRTGGFKGKININLPTNRMGRLGHSSQFSFRDKF